MSKFPTDGRPDGGGGNDRPTPAFPSSFLNHPFFLIESDVLAFLNGETFFVEEVKPMIEPTLRESIQDQWNW